MTLSAIARAESANVPIRLQAELLSKVVSYDRNFESRAAGRAKVLLVVSPSDADSRLAATDMKSALGQLPVVGNVPHDEEIINFTDPAALVEICRSRAAAVAYFTPGFAGRVGAIRDAMGSLPILTVGSVADYVPSGLVLGFDLVSGRPKLVVNLGQARKQSIDFRAEVLRLMKVYQ